ncbi:MAG: pirin-like C-terminal cupin domain-containing protein, partial [Bacteroidales bacterium]|nr:pirin-like C-terminal cupin domain-containing protein [Bacteroidales bacterium]
VIGDLECQWMTAGSGIVHQEMPVASERMLGCQIWLNLPAKYKMTQPAYGDITQDKVIFIEEGNATVRVVAGEYCGKRGAFQGKYVEVTYLDVNLAPDSVWNYNEATNDKTLFIYLLEGQIAADENLVDFEEKACAILFGSSDKDRLTIETICLKSGKEGARFVLLTGKPLGEPISWGGPIVMNTKEELQNAFDELDNGTFIKNSL